MWELWPVIAAGAVVVYLFLRVRETFVIKYGNPFDNEDLLSFDPEAPGTRLFSIWPDTCPLDKIDYDAGLCYEPCAEDYNGVGPVCWARTTNVGVGTMARIKSCSEMGLGPDYRDDPLTCWKDLKCDTGSGWDFFRFDKWKCEGPDLRGKTLACPGNQPAFFSLLTSVLSGSMEKPNLKDYTDLVDGLCYKPCPKERPNRISGMPYLCYKARDAETGLSYGRGVGTVPPMWRFGE